MEKRERQIDCGGEGDQQQFPLWPAADAAQSRVAKGLPFVGRIQGSSNEVPFR